MENCVCFLGHREINISEALQKKITDLLKTLITQKKVTVFLFGSRSQFNDLCYRIVTSLKEKYTYITRIVYPCRNEIACLEKDKPYWEKLLGSKNNLHFYDAEYTYPQKYTSGKGIYVERNQSLIDYSDYCVFYYNEFYLPPRRQISKHSSTYQPNSGTKRAYDYAIKKKKQIFNVFP